MIADFKSNRSIIEYPMNRGSPSRAISGNNPQLFEWMPRHPLPQIISFCHFNTIRTKNGGVRARHTLKEILE